MALKVDATTADVVLALQTAPGTDADTIINAGEAKIVADGKESPVKPQANGFYGMKVKIGGTVDLKVLGTTYTIKHEPEATLEDEAKGLVLAGWQKLGDLGQVHGRQRRLQLLGYYTGRVDDERGEKMERAVLDFQADNNLRTDGITGGNTNPKLDNVVTSKNKFGDTFVIRRSLIRFTRAPSDKDATVKSGIPSAKAPDLDDRGFIKAKSMGSDLRGPVLTMAPDSPFRIKVIREYIAKDVPLHVTTAPADLIEVVSKLPLPNEKEMILELKTAAVKAKTEAELKVVVKQDKTEVTVGVLQIIILPVFRMEVRPYWTIIAGPGGVTPTAPATSKDTWKTIFALVNAIWKPYGMYFHFQNWRNCNVNLSVAGQHSAIGGVYRTELVSMTTAVAPLEQDKINVFVVNSIDGANGLTWSPLRFNWPNAVSIAKNAGEHRGNAGPALDLAHEFGHYLGLANNFGATQYSHAEDDPSAANKKHDIYSMRRLMYGGWPGDDRAEGWAHNVGYGHNASGGVVSVRNLPQDKTDNECFGARKQSRSAKRYRNP